MVSVGKCSTNDCAWWAFHIYVDLPSGKSPNCSDHPTDTFSGDVKQSAKKGHFPTTEKHGRSWESTQEPHVGWAIRVNLFRCVWKWICLQNCNSKRRKMFNTAGLWAAVSKQTCLVKSVFKPTKMEMIWNYSRRRTGSVDKTKFETWRPSNNVGVTSGICRWWI